MGVQVEAHFERVVAVRHDAEQRHEAVRHEVQLRVARHQAAADVGLGRVEEERLEGKAQRDCH